MELRVLNYFLMVAREENITKAANLLHVTQPTLSRQLMQLEAELGVKLFDRSSHSIILTDEGMLLKRRAQELLELADKTKKDFLKADEALAGEISIGSGETLSMGILADVIVSFHQEYPLIHFDLYSGNADSVKERLEQGITDIGLLLEPVDITRYEFIRIPKKEIWGILVRDDSPLASKKYVTPKDLADVPLMPARRELVHNELLHWFGEYADQLNIVETHNLIYNSMLLVKKGLGVALTLQLESHYDGVRFVPLSPMIKTGSVLAWKKHETMSPASSRFIDYARSYIKSISED